NQGATSTSISSTPNPATIGQTVTISVTVSPVAPAAGVPAGTVTIMDGVTSLGVVTLVNGSASLATSALTAGTHSLTAAYGGSPSFLASTSAAVTQPVNVLTTTTVASTPNPSVTGQAVTLTATVSPVAPGTGVPTGTVTFMDGATSVGTATLAAGSASLTTSALGVGSHSLTAVYNGAAPFLGSASSATTQIVNQGGTNTNLTSTPNPSTIGLTVNLTATVTPVAPAAGVPTGTVTFF